MKTFGLSTKNNYKKYVIGGGEIDNVIFNSDLIANQERNEVVW